MFDIFKSPEEKLRNVHNATQENRTRMIIKNADSILAFLDAEDATPTRAQVTSRCTDRLDKLAGLAYSGKKPQISMEFDRCGTYPLNLVFDIFKTMTEAVLLDLGEKDIHPSKIHKPTSYRSKRENSNWTVEEIRNLSLDWCASAVVTYYEAQEKKESKDTCEKQEGVISASEFKECMTILKQGFIDAQCINKDIRDLTNIEPLDKDEIESVRPHKVT